MAKFRKKPVVIEATQWFKNGDHPEDEIREIPRSDGSGTFDSGGKVVRRFRRPDVDGDSGCEQCGLPMCGHGWIDSGGGGFNVCPGDWIITNAQGQHFPCKPDTLEATYEPV